MYGTKVSLPFRTFKENTGKFSSFLGRPYDAARSRRRARSASTWVMEAQSEDEALAWALRVSKAEEDALAWAVRESLLLTGDDAQDDAQVDAQDEPTSPPRATAPLPPVDRKAVPSVQRRGPPHVPKTRATVEYFAVPRDSRPTAAAANSPEPQIGNSIVPSKSNPAQRRRQRECLAPTGGSSPTPASASAPGAIVAERADTWELSGEGGGPRTLDPPIGSRECSSWSLPQLGPPHTWAPTAHSPSNKPPVIVWIRSGDLRIRDNPALAAAAALGAPVIPCFVMPPDDEAGGWPLCGAARYWLHCSLVQLSHGLKERGSALLVRDARGGKSSAEVMILAPASQTTLTC